MEEISGMIHAQKSFVKTLDLPNVLLIAIALIGNGDLHAQIVLMGQTMLMNVKVILEIRLSEVVDLQTQNIITNIIKHATIKTIALWITMVKV
jgi:hypothetical protein